MVKPDVFTHIYKEHNKLVYNLALSYVQNIEDAQDITQEVFVKIHQFLPKFKEGNASLKTIIYRITINHCLDFLKAKKTKKRFGFIVDFFSNESNEPDFNIGDFNHPGVLMENKEELQQLFKAINSLPDQQKTAVILLKIEGRSQKETAEIMKSTSKAVESLFQRAKQNLSKKLLNNKGNHF